MEVFQEWLGANKKYCEVMFVLCFITKITNEQRAAMFSNVIKYLSNLKTKKGGGGTDGILVAISQCGSSSNLIQHNAFYRDNRN